MVESVEIKLRVRPPQLTSSAGEAMQPTAVSAAGWLWRLYETLHLIKITFKLQKLSVSRSVLPDMRTMTCSRKTRAIETIATPRRACMKDAAEDDFVQR